MEAWGLCCSFPICQPLNIRTTHFRLILFSPGVEQWAFLVVFPPQGVPAVPSCLLSILPSCPFFCLTMGLFEIILPHVPVWRGKQRCFGWEKLSPGDAGTASHNWKELQGLWEWEGTWEILSSSPFFLSSPFILQEKSLRSRNIKWLSQGLTGGWWPGRNPGPSTPSHYTVELSYT